MDGNSSSSSSSSSFNGEKWIKHYSNLHKILLVGEGDFSFALSLATAFGSASNIVATSLDSEDEVVSKYSKAKTHLRELKEKGCTILHKVDVRRMSKHRRLRNRTFDRIVFNFPHAPLVWGWGECHRLQIRDHQKLVKSFMRNACEMLTEKGEVHVTHKTTQPYCKWEIEDLAKEVGLNNLIGKEKFEKWEYGGYENKRGYGRCNRSFPIGECCTFKFAPN